jgi:hypothetical protein
MLGNRSRSGGSAGASPSRYQPAETAGSRVNALPVDYERGFFNVKVSSGTNPDVKSPEAFSPALHDPQEPHEPAFDAPCRPERNVCRLRRTT